MKPFSILQLSITRNMKRLSIIPEFPSIALTSSVGDIADSDDVITAVLCGDRVILFGRLFVTAAGVGA